MNANQNNIIEPRIMIVTISTPNRFEFSNAIAVNQQKYAARHGYGYIRYTESFDITRPPEWSKILAVLEQMHISNAEWLVWIDDDILITNFNIKVEEIINTFARENINLIIAQDAYHERDVPINTGIFLIRNCPWSSQFLLRIWKEGALRNYLVFRQSLLEQRTLTDLALEDQSVREKMQVVSQRVMNSFSRYPSYDDPEDSRWRAGDFVVHLTGLFPADRLRKLEGFLSQGDNPQHNVE